MQVQHFSDRSELRNLCHFCPLTGWFIQLSHESPTLHLSFSACSILSILLFSSSGGPLFPSHIPSPFTSSCIHLVSPYRSCFLSLTKKTQTHKKPHVPTLLFITGINILVNNLINHSGRTVGANPTALVLHPLCKLKWKFLKGWPSKKQKKPTWLQEQPSPNYQPASHPSSSLLTIIKLLHKFI